jgi:hypothetical protein
LEEKANKTSQKQNKKLKRLMEFKEVHKQHPLFSLKFETRYKKGRWVE